MYNDSVITLGGHNRIHLGSICALIFAGLGIFATIVLVGQSVFSFDVPCATNQAGCNAVLDSNYSKIFGIPVALLGLLSFVGLFAGCAIWFIRSDALESRLFKLLYAACVFCSCISLCLAVFSKIEIGTSCTWCQLTSILFLLLTLDFAIIASTPHPHGSILKNEKKSKSKAILPVAIGIIAIASGTSTTFALSRIPPEFSHNQVLLSSIEEKHLIPRDSASIVYGTPRIAAIIFSDPKCPACISSVPMIVDALRSRDNVKIVFRHFLLKDTNERLAGAIEIEIAAQSPSFFDNGARLTNVEHPAHSANFGNDYEAARQRVYRDTDLAHRLQIPGTPAVVLISFDGTRELLSPRMFFKRYGVFK